MMRFLILFISVILIQGCDKVVSTCEQCTFNCIDQIDASVITNDCFSNWDCDFKLNTNSAIETTKNVIIQGDKIVFELTASTEGSAGLADDEVVKKNLFEIDSSLSSFSFEDNDLIKLNTLYSRICYCSETEFKKINSGCIQGEMLEDKSWRVQGSLTVPYSSGDILVEFDAIFQQ